MPSDDELRYPVGKFSFDSADATAHRTERIDLIAKFPETFQTAYEAIEPARRHRSYRPGGWNADQLVHHVADSHGNAVFRMKLALTEDTPTIKPYDQAKWAELADVKTVPVDVSFSLIEALHRRWVALLRAMQPADFDRPPACDVFMALSTSHRASQNDRNKSGLALLTPPGPPSPPFGRTGGNFFLFRRNQGLRPWTPKKATQLLRRVLQAIHARRSGTAK